MSVLVMFFSGFHGVKSIGAFSVQDMKAKTKTSGDVVLEILL